MKQEIYNEEGIRQATLEDDLDEIEKEVK